MAHYRIGLVDDHLISQQGISAVLATADTIELVVVASSVEELLRHGKPELDAVVLDYQLDTGGLTDDDAVEHLATTLGYNVLVISALSNDIPVLLSWYGGASGYLTKGALSAEIIYAIETVAAGDPYFSPTVAGYLLREKKEILTKHEIDVMELVAEGLTDVEISNALYLSYHTIKGHMEGIKNKIGENRRTAVAAYVTSRRVQTRKRED